jgi:hypothetical protein
VDEYFIPRTIGGMLFPFIASCLLFAAMLYGKRSRRALVVPLLLTGLIWSISTLQLLFGFDLVSLVRLANGFFAGLWVFLISGAISGAISTLVEPSEAKTSPPEPGPAEDLSTPLGICPSCDARIALSSPECRHCNASFGPQSAWKVGPI